MMPETSLLSEETQAFAAPEGRPASALGSCNSAMGRARPSRALTIGSLGPGKSASTDGRLHDVRLRMANLRRCRRSIMVLLVGTVDWRCLASPEGRLAQRCPHG